MQKYVLIVIIIIASFLRIYRLESVPISPDWDEVAHGYNAYSLLKTGKDEFGVFLPLALKSFGEYKPPLYAYLSMPFIWIFGLNVFSIRIVAALSGIFAVFGTYILTKELFLLSECFRKKEKSSNNMNIDTRNREHIITWRGLITAFLLAISPWHIQFSRVAFESIVAVTLNIWSVAFFLKGLKNSKYLILASFGFALSMYSYHSQRIFAPLMVVFLCILFLKVLVRIEYKRNLIWSFLIGIFIVIPLVPILLSPQGRERFITTSPFLNQDQMLKKTLEKQTEDMKNGDRSWIIFDNRRIVWIKAFLQGYLTHFSLKWLFITGDQNTRHHAPDNGLLYIWELPFFLYGLYILFKKNDFSTCIIGIWLLFSLIPASVTNELPHAGRTMILLPMPQIITAIGIYNTLNSGFLSYIRKQKLIRGIIFFYSLFMIFNISYYFLMYFVRLNIETARDWQYGYKQAVSFAESVKYRYKKIIVSMNLEQPYVFFLFYTKFNPSKYLADGGTMWDAPTNIKQKFDTYEFRYIDWKKEHHDGSVLYIGTPYEMPPGNRLRIYYPNGKPAMEISDE